MAHTTTWRKESGYDNETKIKQENPNVVTRRTREIDASRTKKQELSDRLGEARSKYGNDFILVNEGSEDDPNWKIIHQPMARGSAGIKEEDIFDRWL
ncbi:DUF4148 domain-containing protein [Bacillus sp. RA(2023)]|uniref:DUF4148 domain-containing protein n=1 Tax=Bacillus TaxID=1386 RepID=UPI002115DA50|nr:MULTISPECIES: DUF4148 domain-containing protein [Bacillus]MCU5408846.1 DUF4148 domain-containing protein [Bacillus cereus]MDA2459770.1 DUF4148 domain-containing protein [Bacillus cereus]WPU74766.1 DUF4148 domain-containing protein [Bacillus sp. RA(2023)]